MNQSPTNARQRSPDHQPVDTAEPTPVHQRTSRRLRGDSPEFSPLHFTPRGTQSMDAATMTSHVTPAQVVINQPHQPPVFHGDSYEDVEDWLNLFERVARLNGWDEREKLRRVYFALEDFAKTWYENHETSFTTWDEFRRQALATYASADRKEKAQAALESRNQLTNESVAMYIEDMIRLFKRADSHMTEDKKLRHLMRGVKQELFAVLVRNPPRTVAEFHTDVTAIEKTLEQRARQYNRDINYAPANVFSGRQRSDMDALRELIRSVIREELSKLQAPHTTATLSVVDVVRDELRQMIREPERAPQPIQRIPTYSEVLRQPAAHTNAAVAMASPCPQTVRSAPRPLEPTATYLPRARGVARYVDQRPRKSDIWRDHERRPLCFHCGEAGHLYRFCPYRQAGLRGFPLYAPCPRNGERPTEIEEYLSARQSPLTPRQHQPRSPSPRRYRSPSPRTSSTRSGHHSTSPHPEN